MKPTFSFLFIAASFFLFNSCKDNGSEPQERKIKSPLDMTWTYEVISPTIGSQLMMSSIYGSNYKDIWICGHSSVNQGSLWHYDGNKWTEVNPLLGNESGPISLTNIMGFSSNNIWLVGTRYVGSGPNEKLKCLVLNRNGNSWIDQKIETLGRLLTVYGDSPTNIWAGGNNGIITHYNGSKWFSDSINLKNVNPSNFWIKAVIVYNGKPIILGRENDGVKKINTYFITGDINSWRVIDSNKVVQEQTYTSGEAGMLLSKSNRLFSFGALGVWEWINSKWIKFYDTKNYISALHSINDNYILAAGSASFIAFYDGATWKQIPQVKNMSENVQFEAVWTDGTEVFIVGYSTGGFPNKTYIWHGK